MNITGCSSGYGQETARHFHSKGWNVIASMRTPREDLLPRSEGLRVLALDVTRPESTMPLVAVYTASKMAIEGFTASLAFELEAFGVRVKLVEPGYGPTTRFTNNSRSRLEGLIPEAYAPFAQSIFASLARPAAVTTESDVAEAVWRAANDGSGQLRFPAGADALVLAQQSRNAGDAQPEGRSTPAGVSISASGRTS